MVLHLAGDVYAHKTRIPTSVQFASSYSSTRDTQTIYKGNTAGTDFYYTNNSNRWNGTKGIKTLLNAGHSISTMQIGEWQIKEKGANGRTEYTDSISFYPNRFNVGAMNFTNKILNSYADGSTFKATWFVTGLGIKLDSIKNIVISLLRIMQMLCQILQHLL